MNLKDSISTFDGAGVSRVGLNALNNAGIFYWYQAKDARANGRLCGARGVGRKTVEAVIRGLQNISQIGSE